MQNIVWASWQYRELNVKAAVCEANYTN